MAPLLDPALERAVEGLRCALVASARSGRTVTAGEACAAAYGAWVPAGLSRALAELSLRCASAEEPDLTALVEHRRRPPGGRSASAVIDLTDLTDRAEGAEWAEWADRTGGADGADGAARVARERCRCWRAWCFEPATGVAHRSAPRRSTWQHPAAGAFAEPGVVCGGCLSVIRPSGACRCR